MTNCREVCFFYVVGVRFLMQFGKGQLCFSCEDWVEQCSFHVSNGRRRSHVSIITIKELMSESYLYLHQP